MVKCTFLSLSSCLGGGNLYLRGTVFWHELKRLVLKNPRNSTVNKTLFSPANHHLKKLKTGTTGYLELLGKRFLQKQAIPRRNRLDDAGPTFINTVNFDTSNLSESVLQRTNGATFYQRLLLNGSKYHSLSYVRKKGCVSFMVSFTRNGIREFGAIDVFFEAADGEMFAIISRYRQQDDFGTFSGCPGLLPDHIIVTKGNERVLVPISDIRHKCFGINVVGELLVLREILSHFEHD
jgi:hypothetical protein